MGEPRYTEKEMVMAKREAFTDGAVCWAGQVRDELRGGIGGRFVTLANIKADAHTKFPLPRVERPRVEPDPLSPGVEWQVCDLLGCPTLRWKSLDTPEWRIYPAGNGGIHHMPSKERAALWWNLFSHPSEFVDDEG